jgi:uncharacterized protein
MNTHFTNMNFRTPNYYGKMGLGLGIDIKWGDKMGFKKNENGYLKNDLKNFIKKNKNDFNYAFLSFQPKNRNKLSSLEYINTYQEFFNLFDNIKYRSMHHNMLNLGTTENYYKKEIIDFTNELIESLNLQWINEDVGI